MTSEVTIQPEMNMADLLAPKGKVLIVEDDVHLRGALQIWLAKANYDVETACDGEEALRMLEDGQKFDLILTDLMMPEVNGMELIADVKSTPAAADIPVLVMSNNTDPEFKDRAIELGAIDYLYKAHGARAIVERIIETVGGEPLPSSGPVLNPASGVELRVQCENLIEILRMARRSENLPDQVREYLTSAEKIAARIERAVA